MIIYWKWTYVNSKFYFSISLVSMFGLLIGAISRNLWEFQIGPFNIEVGL